MIESVVLAAAVSGLVTATLIAAGGYPLTAVLAGYFAAGALGAGLMLLGAFLLQRRRAKAARQRDRGTMASA